MYFILQMLRVWLKIILLESSIASENIYLYGYLILGELSESDKGCGFTVIS